MHSADSTKLFSTDTCRSESALRTKTITNVTVCSFSLDICCTDFCHGCECAASAVVIYEIDAEDDAVLLFLSELILSIIAKTKKILYYFLMSVYSIVLHPFFTLDIGILSQIIFSWMNLQEKKHHFSSPQKGHGNRYLAAFPHFE